MVKEEKLEDRVEVDEDEFLLAMYEEIKRIDAKRAKYVSVLNQVQTYKAFNFDVKYFFDKAENTYIYEYEKKDKIGFKVGEHYDNE